MDITFGHDMIFMMKRQSFYDNAEILYRTRSQEFNRSIVGSYMAEDNERLSSYKSMVVGRQSKTG